MKGKLKGKRYLLGNIIYDLDHTLEKCVTFTYDDLYLTFYQRKRT